MANKLSKQSEKRLIESLEKVSALISNGEHPNEAIFKVASENKIPAGHVRLMVNAVNTGQTNSHRASATSPLEKAADFPLAEAENILARLYPSTVKTAAEVFLQKVVDPQYNRSPSWLKDHKRVKTAKAPIDFKMTNEKPIVERDPDYAMKTAVAHVQRNMRNVDDARLDMERVRQKAVKLAEDLRTYFKRPGHVPYPQVRDNALIMFGKQASAIINIVEPTLSKKQKEDVNKPYIPVDANAAPYSIIKSAIALAAEFKQSKEAYQTAVKTANDESETLLRPFVQSPESVRSVLGLPSSTTTEKTSFFGGLVNRALGATAVGDIAKDIGKKVPGMQPTGDIERSELSSLLDPSHEMEIRNIQSEALLNDLMANDDVIRGHDPEDVIDAFNEVSQIAPYAVNKKAIMRDLMRKRLAGGGAALDQFTVGDALKSQQTLRDLESVNDKSLNAMSVLGVLPSAQQSSKSVLGGR